MWRDRTNLYISYRQSYSHRPAKRPRFGGSNTYNASSSSFRTEERRGLISAADQDDETGDTIIEMDLLPPRWADVSDEVNEILSSIGKKSAKLDKLHQKHVLPGFDDKSAEEGEIERLTMEITKGFHDCQNAIQRIGRMAKSGPGAASSRAEEVMSRNIQVSLAAKVQEASSAFRRKQAAYLKQLRGLNGMTSPLDRASSPYQQSQLQDEDADVSYSRSALQQSATLTSNDAAIMQREREISEIAKGIIELADIFKELQTMVIDQGTMLDRIDYNIENMAVHVKAAEKELVVASGYQRKSAKRKFILLLIILIVGLIILLIIKPKKGSSPVPVKEQPPPAPPKEVTPAPPPEEGPSKIARFMTRGMKSERWKRRICYTDSDCVR